MLEWIDSSKRNRAVFRTVEINRVIALVLCLLRVWIGPHWFDSILSQIRKTKTKTFPACFTSTADWFLLRITAASD